MLRGGGRLQRETNRESGKPKPQGRNLLPLPSPQSSNRRPFHCGPRGLKAEGSGVQARTGRAVSFG